MIQKAKHESMRNNNTLMIIEYIKNFGPVTKKMILEKTGLSWGAISNITTELLSKRIIIEYTHKESSVGRTPTYLQINSNENLLIGIDINISWLSLVLTDLSSNIKESIRYELKSNEKDSIILQAIELIHGLMNKASITKDKILGIGIAMHGSVDVDKGVSIFAPHFKDWHNVPIKSIFEKEFGIPVFLEHDPNCMAMSEKWFGSASGCDNYLFLRLSTGIGMSIIINDSIYRGADGNAGEFGHIILDVNGAKCNCGNYGCLEAYASVDSIIQKARDALQNGRSNILKELVGSGDSVNLKTIISAYRQGDDYIKRIVDDVCTFIGIGICNLINLFNPELIIIAGDLIDYSDIFIEKIKKVVIQNRWRSSSVNIITSKLESNSAALGAAAIIIQKFFKGEEINDSNK